MKIAISSTGKDLEAEIDPRFGRCAYFLFVDTGSMNVEAFDNKSIALSGGAGIQAAQFVSSKGANVVLTGNCGPNAVKTLNASGVQLFTGQSGPAKNALDAYLQGSLERASEANVPDHYGLGGNQSGSQQGAYRGFGQGRGGMGKGQGCRRGTGIGSGPGAWTKGQMQSQADPPDKETDLAFLKKKAEELKKQIDTLESQIRRLEQD